MPVITISWGWFSGGQSLAERAAGPIGTGASVARSWSMQASPMARSRPL
jgi:hypothetical protein